MMKTVSAAALTLLLTSVAAPALAQSAPDWSGFYGGLSGGVQENNEQAGESLVFDRDFDGAFDDTVVTVTGADAFGPGSCSGGAMGSELAAGCDVDPTSPDISFRLGYDFQMGALVLGAVAEWSAVDVEDSVSSFSTTPAAYVMTRQLDDMAALRARLGVAAGSGLYYVTAGAAYGGMEHSFRTTNQTNSFAVRKNEDDADGWQLGAGLEWRIAPKVSLVGEYLFTSLEVGDFVVRAGPGSAAPTNPFILPPNTVGTDISRSNDEMELHALKIGVNMRF
jgi:outer membrane immunogenic protein